VCRACGSYWRCFSRVHKTTKSDYWLRLVCLSVCPSVGPHSTTRLQLDGLSCNTTALHFSCWITQATNRHSEHVTLITFPRQQRLRERTSIRRYMHIACLVTYKQQNGYWFCVCVFYMNCTALRHTCQSNAFI
jgi:hypothetical protein